jgi:hypothetical protein
MTSSSERPSGGGVPIVVVSPTREEPEVAAQQVAREAENGPTRARTRTLPILVGQLPQEIK